jgi:hypothetical protein
MSIIQNLTAEKQKIVADALKIYTTADDDVKAAIAKGTSWAARNMWYVVLGTAVVFFVIGLIA